MRRQLRIVSTGAVCVLLAGAATVRAQGRFEALSRERVAGAADVEIITVRDKTLNTCYSLFLLNTATPALNPAQIAAPTAEDAAIERDHRLSELSTAFERARSSVVAGAPGPDWLKYQWEGQKAQNEFERVVREKNLARLETQIRQIAEAPKLAVSGPAPCSVRAPSPDEPAK